MTTRVINIKEAPNGWELDSRFVYIGRAGRDFEGTYGNPFPLKKESDRGLILQKYMWFLEVAANDHDFRAEIKALKGKTLVCFCTPKLCHGDILALLAEVL